MNWVKVVFFNLGIMFALSGLMLLTPPILENSAKLVEHLFFKHPDKREGLAIYDKYEWSDRYFREHRELGSNYYDYITWRRNDYSGETINVVDGIRHTSAAAANQDGSTEIGSEYWFFGGSTTWGSGVNDENTFPSIFAKKNGVPAVNFGESAYIARQSLALLQNRYITRPRSRASTSRVIVFYDGVNEVLLRCRNETKGLGTGREAQIRQILLGGKWSFYRTFSQLIDYLGKQTDRIINITAEPGSSFYDCASDPLRANFVAETLVNTWHQARITAQANGDEFIAVLQPVAFIGSADIPYLNLTGAKNQELARQYEAVYPLIDAAAKALNMPFINLADVYDGCNDCYIDFCHVGPQAHQLLVARMTKEIAKTRAVDATQ